MYSLVSAPVLGFDLTRLAGGSATAEVVLRGLRLQPADLPILAERLPDEGFRGPLWVEVESAARRMPSLRGMSKEDPASSLALVERAPIGSVDALLTCLRYDVMSWTWTGAGRDAKQTDSAASATALLCDAAVGSYLREVLDDDTRRRLGAGWVSAMRKLPVAAAGGSEPAGVLGGGCPAQRGRLVPGRPLGFLGRVSLGTGPHGRRGADAVGTGRRHGRHPAGRPGRWRLEHAQRCRAGARGP
jgi:hypothetical protein